MKRKLTALILSAATLFAVCSFTGCKNDDKATRMTVDINPSVEFILDKDNKVVSATALNDEGAVVLVGETFVGKTADEAARLVVSIATDSGYLVKGEAVVADGNVKISVSGSEKEAKKIYDKAAKKVKSYLDDKGITAAVAQVEAAKTEELKKLALANSTYTEAELEGKTDEQLVAIIKLGRIETAELLTQEMRDAYFKAKEHKISIVEREETGKIIEAAGGLYAVMYKGYETALKEYDAAITAMDEARYNLLVSPDSQYQKLLAAMRDAKAEVLKERKIVASITVDGEEKIQAQANLRVKEENYDRLYDQLVALGNSANETWSQAIASARAFEETLKSIKDSLPTEITSQLTAKAQEIENKANAAKDGFFASFESAHAEDITKAENDLKAYKAALKAQANG